MGEINSQLYPLILTKLHRPPLPVDLVRRPRLTKWLEQRRSRPLTLVSAPAGYGKSTLISCWLESVDRPTAWLSLDERDNELGIFLGYFLAAVQTIFPSAVPETQSLLAATQLPPVPAIAKILINELDQIEQPFTLVLDDYHLIENQSIHGLLNELLLHPPRNLYLVLGTRMDPLLPLVTLRANGQLTEIRTQDLRFNLEETSLLFQQMIGNSLDQPALLELDTQAEGWVTGLRLAALVMHHRIGRDSFQGSLSLNNRYVTEYLISEILSKQAASLSDCMLKTSILDRFCAGLCEAVCFQETELTEGRLARLELNGRQFLDWLSASNLFVIHLDDQGNWFRYHHLFRDFLQRELSSRKSIDQIATLHAAAGRWYGQNGWIEEALNHLLAADYLDEAIHLVAQHRYSMMNAAQWPRLERWLNLFSTEVVENSGELFMLKIWLVYHHGRFSELPGLLDHLDAIITCQPDQATEARLAGEISSLQCLVAYHRSDAGEAIAQARQALDLVPPELWIVRVLARMYLGGSLLLRGDVNGGYHAYYDAFEEEKVQDKRFKATLLMTVCNFHWITADLLSMAQAAKQCITLCKEIDFQEILGYGEYQLGRVYYQLNNLPAAEEIFACVVARPYLNYGISFTHSACGLAMTYQSLGREVEARQVTESVITFLLETGNTTQLPFALALQAELALAQGRLPAAIQWAEKLDPVPPLVPMFGFLAPHLTLVKIWLAQNTPASLAKAADLLTKLHEYLAGTHNTRFLIETRALQALWDQAAGNQAAALVALEEGLSLAQPGGFIRLFVDLGPELAHLLAHLKVDDELGSYLAQIRSAFTGSLGIAPSLDQTGLLESLTNREFQVLELLGDRLTNKEIATRLVISPGTVKGHTIQIYQKLNVTGRRQAVEKAIKLGLLAPT